MAANANIEHADLIRAEETTSKANRCLTCLKNAKWKIFFLSLVLLLGLLVGIIIYVEVYIGSFRIRVDCYPDLPLNYQKCLERGCIWVQRKDSPPEPPCFFPHGYGYHSIGKYETKNGYYINLERTNDDVIYGKEIKNIALNVYFETPQRLHLKFVDPSQKRYEVPIDVPDIPEKSPDSMDYEVEFTHDPQFGIVVKRKSSGTVIFDSNLPGMIFSDQYIQISTKLASSNLYGIGEHASPDYKHSMNWKSWSLFARDTVPDNDDNLYGVHPFYMNVENSGDAHGVFFLSSNAMEVVLQPYPALTFRTIGGILDMYIFLGPTPEDVVKQYQKVIGLPFMPPYWSLGFHLSRYGYHSVDDVRKVSSRTIDAKIPYDVQHFDIDYMQNYRDFTYDKYNFQTLPGFVDELHNKNLKVVIILDPAIASNKTLKGQYNALDYGEKLGIFIKLNGTFLEGEVWPGKTYFPDFSHDEAEKYWSTMCADFRNSEDVKYDAIWIDMNEPASFVEGSLNGCEKNSLNYPPYPAGILGSEKDGKLFEKTICMDATQNSGRHYDVHSLYGFFQARVTFNTLIHILGNQRPMVLSRSTFPGTGRYAAHWLGDNNSSWSQMRDSIPGILEFSLFGIPFVGADICGFRLNATEELCLRWTQLGAFYPFARNHNAKESSDQDPAFFGSKFVEDTRRALLTRYELLPYLYTLFYFAHTEGSTVSRPLLHEFPQDEVTWGINEQFLWGPALLISPILYENAQSVDAYFPEGIWYDFYSGKQVKEGKGVNIVLKDEGNISLHVRGGHILPLQKPSVTTVESRKMPMGLFIAPSENGSASGSLFWDNGITRDTNIRNEYLLLQFDLQKVDKKVELSSEVKKSGFSGNFHFGYMTICQQDSSPTEITLNGKKLESDAWNYSALTKVVNLLSLNITLSENFNLVLQYA